MFVYTIHDIIGIAAVTVVLGPIILLILFDVIKKRLTRKKK